MRAWFSAMAFGAALAFLVGPTNVLANADHHISRQHMGNGRHLRVFAPPFFPSSHLSHFGSFDRRRTSGFPFLGFGPFGDFAPLLDEGMFEAASAAIRSVPPMEIGAVPAFHIPASPRREGDDRPSVEQTSQGVDIVRGPGSHHIAH